MDLGIRCDGAPDNANVSGCITRSTDESSYNSDMIPEYLQDYEEPGDVPPGTSDWVSECPGANGRGDHRQAGPRRDRELPTIRIAEGSARTNAAGGANGFSLFPCRPRHGVV